MSAFASINDVILSDVVDSVAQSEFCWNLNYNLYGGRHLKATTLFIVCTFNSHDRNENHLGFACY